MISRMKSLTQWTSHLELVPYNFPLVVLHTISIFSILVFEFEWRETCFGSLRAKLILVPLGMAK